MSQYFINNIVLFNINMSTSIIRKNLPYDARQRRYELGEQGELNVGKLLCEYFGHRKVSYGFDNYSEGTNGYPDIVLNLNPPIAIEVKSIAPFTKKKNAKGIYKSAQATRNNRFIWQIRAGC